MSVTITGYKDILSITVGANETSKFWLGMLNDLKNRGVKDVLFFCVDGLPGFKEAIQAVYPQAEIQRCVVSDIFIWLSLDMLDCPQVALYTVLIKRKGNPRAHLTQRPVLWDYGIKTMYIVTEYYRSGQHIFI